MAAGREGRAASAGDQANPAVAVGILRPGEWKSISIMATASNRISSLRSLLIDDMREMRANLRNQLHQLGIERVDQAQTGADALRLLKANKYGLVLCDYNLGDHTNGQQLLEFIKAKKLLPASTIFFMVTAETTYTYVVAAGEFAPDDYLIKPFTASNLEARLQRHFEKQDALAPVLKRLGAMDLSGAAAQCDRLIADQSKYTMEAFRLKGQALMDLGRPEEARQVYAGVLSIRPDIPWAELGAACALKASGEAEKAKAAALALIEANPQFVGAYELLAEIQREQSDMDEAFKTLQQVEAIVPSTRRARVVGEMAYEVGDLAVARASFEKVISATKNSVTKSSRDSSSLSQVYVDVGEPKKALDTLKAVQREFSSEPAFKAMSAAVESRAHRDLGNHEAAESALDKALALASQGGSEAAIVVSRACLAAGRETEGVNLLAAAVRSNHEDTRLVALAKRVLKETGHEDKTQQLVDKQVNEMLALTGEALSTAKKAKLDEAVAMITEAVTQLPNNPGVLLAAAQINLLWLSQKGLNLEFVNRIKSYMTKLDALMPGHERVLKMNHFFRVTLAQVAAAKE